MMKNWLLAKMAISIILCFASVSSAALKFGGDSIITSIKTGEDQIYINAMHNRGSVYMVWRVETLMGEPVVNGQGMIIIPDQKTYHARYKNKTYQVPAEIIKKISVVDVDVKMHLGENLFITVNLGAMADIYFGGSLTAKELPEAEKTRYMSYNVPGSPEWDDFLYRDNQGFTVQYLSEEQAKIRIKNGIRIVPLGSSARVKFNFNPVINWIENRADKKRAAKKENPFNKFEKMNEPAAMGDLKEVDAEIQAFVINACGKYYTRVEEGSPRFHLTAEYLGETREKRKKREKKAKAYNREREARVKRAKQKIQNMLPGLQRRFREKRASIQADCRAYIMKKYALTLPAEELEKLMTRNFTSTENYNAVYYIPFDGYLNN